MQREIRYDSLEAFLFDLKDLWVNRIAFCETSEKRAAQVEPQLLQVVHVDKVELVAYRDSVIYKCVMRDVDREALYERLVRLGFNVARRSRNIT
jgi:hypothetical protein